MKGGDIARPPTFGPIPPTTPTLVHTFPTASTSGVPVILTIKDNFGRTSVKTLNVVVQ